MAALQMTALEGQHEGEVLETQFSPRQVVLEYATVWEQQFDKKRAADLEFEKSEPARMHLELLFDEAESSQSVQPQIDKLHRFTSVDAILHRPPRVRVAWGNEAGVIPSFDAVIESLSVRYALFTEDGLPARATADVRLRQAAHVTVHVP
jgi:hypothetical protein